MAENKENSSLLNITDSTNNSQISMTESVVMSEGIVHSTPVPNNRAENKEIMEMMQMLFNTQNNNFNVKFDEIKNEIKKQNINFDNRITKVEVCCTNMPERVVEIISEKYDDKINSLNGRISTNNETVISKVRNQIETQYEQLENKCLTTISEQIESRTNCETSRQIEMKTSILQNKIEKCEFDVIDINKHFEIVDRTVLKNESNTNERMSMLQNKIEKIDNLVIQNDNDVHVKCKVIENDLMKMKNELRGEIQRNYTGTTERIIVTRDAYGEIELENFNYENRIIHPIRFLDQAREYSRFSNQNWEIQLMKIVRCFKGNSIIWVEAHRVEWDSFETFERAFKILAGRGTREFEKSYYGGRQFCGTEQHNYVRDEII